MCCQDESELRWWRLTAAAAAVKKIYICVYIPTHLIWQLHLARTSTGWWCQPQKSNDDPFYVRVHINAHPFSLVECENAWDYFVLDTKKKCEDGAAKVVWTKNQVNIRLCTIFLKIYRLFTKNILARIQRVIKIFLFSKLKKKRKKIFSW